MVSDFSLVEAAPGAFFCYFNGVLPGDHPYAGLSLRDFALRIDNFDVSTISDV